MTFNVEMFACSGGMAEGFRRAGVHFGLVIDHDPNACASYEHNLGHRPIRIDVRDFLRLVRTGYMLPSIDLLVADPPCTPWSNAGKRQGLDDERDCLRETIEIIRLLRPRTYLIGNVPGLETEPNRKAVHDTIGSLVRDGYCVADAAILDAADYGVPQRRIRPFWFGHLDGPCLRWPASTHAAPSSTLAIDGMALEAWVTVRAALAHLPPEEIGKPVRLRRRPSGDPHASHVDGVARTVRAKDTGDGTLLYEGEKQRGSRRRARERHPSSRPDRPAKTIASSQPGNGGAVLEWSEDVDDRPSDADAPAKTITATGRGHNGACIVDGLLVNDKHPINRPDEPSYTISTKGDGRGAQGACVIEWPWDRPSTTVTTRQAVPPPGHHPESGSILTLPGAVKITERAAAILQGFPEGWLFAGKTKTARWSQIGQAMPPPLAEAVARAIVARAARQEAAE
jgi:DNA-cytosine methyltransferase